MVTAHFIKNDLNNTEIFVKDIPANYQFAPGERLVDRQITEQEYALFVNDKYKHVKIYRYVDQQSVDKTIPPKGVDYKTGLVTRLFEAPFINVQGFLESMEFYGNGRYDAPTAKWVYTDLILKERYNYTIDPTTKYVIARTKIVTWYKEDGTAHPDQKVMFKPYSIIEMDEEAIRRRSNIITAIKLELAKFASYMTTVQYPDPTKRPDSNEVVKAISAPFNLPMRSYIDAGDRDTLLNLINATTHPFFSYTIPWLGMSPKQLVKQRIS